MTIFLQVQQAHGGTRLGIDLSWKCRHGYSLAEAIVLARLWQCRSISHMGSLALEH